MSTGKGPVHTRLSRCRVAPATRQMPRLRFPFIVTGVMWLAALAGALPPLRHEGGQALIRRAGRDPARWADAER